MLAKKGILNWTLFHRIIIMSRIMSFLGMHKYSSRLTRKRRGRHVVFTLCLLILVVCVIVFRPPPSNQQTERPRRNHVLIVSYFRAGSSAIRRLFEQHDDVLVWEDPVAPLAAGWRHMHHDERMRNQRDRDRALLIEEVSQREDSQVEPLLSAILSCDIGAVYQVEPAVLEWAVGRQLYDAMGLVERMLFVTLGPFGLGAGILSNRCLQFGLSVVRTTHLPMRHLPTLVNANPDLKVIFVPRDPRSIVSSWVEMDIFDESLSHRVTKKFCDGISHDVMNFNRAAAAHPQSLLRMRIEDTQSDPASSLATINEFLNICKTPQSGPRAESKEHTWELRDEQIHLKRSLDHRTLVFGEVDEDWGRVLGSETVKLMTDVCKHALVKLSYESFGL
ncbi:hypothetical protein CAPTEDRAFT_209987 [Capitella teleta]|uniref:Sulfotransferase domain-containing protein n=1 Tax=Capitella teleta TaxID=283909 RepID=R7V7D8_CAPTE|nr:hypothetical protein CAPTEDRAFT_209987 [Capitella teleta]|eukprot:ELU14763.1 hypothetical protein CAPTEDRAFT_209987 [Capitella teleta]